MSKAVAVTALTLLAFSAAIDAQTAPRWLVGRDSTLTFIATQQGGAFEGRFEAFEAEVRFAPDQLDASRIAVTVDTGSVDTRLAERDEALRTAEFFNVMRWPEAHFEATRFVSLGNGQLEASGELTIRDQTRAIEVPFTFQSTDDGAELSGEFTLSRLSFGIGQGEWADTDVIGPNVRVLFRLNLLR